MCDSTHFIAFDMQLFLMPTEQTTLVLFVWETNTVMRKKSKTLAESTIQTTLVLVWGSKHCDEKETKNLGREHNTNYTGTCMGEQTLWWERNQKPWQRAQYKLHWYLYREQTLWWESSQKSWQRAQYILHWYLAESTIQTILVLVV